MIGDLGDLDAIRAGVRDADGIIHTAFGILPARSIGPDEAEAHFGPILVWVAGNGPASSARTRTALGWVPREAGIIADIERPDYSG